jgi:hypothetical protein
MTTTLVSLHSSFNRGSRWRSGGALRSTTAPLVPLVLAAPGPSDNLLVHARTVHAALLAAAPHAYMSVAEVAVAAGLAPTGADVPVHSLFQAGIACGLDEEAAAEAAADLDIALLLVGPVHHSAAASLMGSAFSSAVSYNDECDMHSSTSEAGSDSSSDCSGATDGSEMSDKLHAVLLYNTSILNADSAVLLARHFQVFLC